MIRIHYRSEPGVIAGRAYCGHRTKIDRRTHDVEAVTCKRCVKKLWRAIALAHYRAFGAGTTSAHGIRLRRAVSQSELATRGKENAA